MRLQVVKQFVCRVKEILAGLVSAQLFLLIRSDNVNRGVLRFSNRRILLGEMMIAK